MVTWVVSRRSPARCPGSPSTEQPSSFWTRASVPPRSTPRTLVAQVQALAHLVMLGAESGEHQTGPVVVWSTLNTFGACRLAATARRPLMACRGRGPTPPRGNGRGCAATTTCRSIPARGQIHPPPAAAAFAGTPARHRTRINESCKLLGRVSPTRLPLSQPSVTLGSLGLFRRPPSR